MALLELYIGRVVGVVACHNDGLGVILEKNKYFPCDNRLGTAIRGSRLVAFEANVLSALKDRRHLIGLLPPAALDGEIDIIGDEPKVATIYL